MLKFYFYLKYPFKAISLADFLISVNDTTQMFKPQI